MSPMRDKVSARSKPFAELQRRHAHILPEGADEIGGTGKAAVDGDLLHAGVAVGQLVFGGAQAGLDQVFMWGKPISRWNRRDR